MAPAQRRRMLARKLLRAGATAAVLVALYYLMPLDHISDVSAGVLLAAGLVGVTAIIVIEIRSIMSSDYPALRAVETLAMTVPLFLLMFATVYYLLARGTAGSFSETLSRTDALYFTITTFSTVGYGDITATSETARVIVMVQMLADLVVIGFGVKAVFTAVQMGRQRRGEAVPMAPPTPTRPTGAGPS